MSEYNKFEHPCDVCIHRINDYCKAYQTQIELLDVSYCKRRKIKKRV